MSIPNGSCLLPVDLAIPTSAGMRSLGRRLAEILRPGDLVILSGPLGAGKTTLTKGIADGLGVRGPVTSPTFVIARVHPPLAGGGFGGSPSLVHADAYRLGSALELDDLDLDADLDTSVTVVEWGAGRAEGLSEDRLEIVISSAPAGESPAPEADTEGTLDDDISDVPRTVRVSGVGSRWQDIQLPHVEAMDRL